MPTVSPTVGFASSRDQAPTLQANGTATAPTAGTTIATFAAAPTAGNWELVTAVVIGTAVAIVDANNVGVYVNGVQKAAVPVTPTVLVTSAQMPMVFALNVGDVVTLRAIASATATSVYNVTGTLRPIS